MAAETVESAAEAATPEKQPLPPSTRLNPTDTTTTNTSVSTTGPSITSASADTTTTTTTTTAKPTHTEAVSPPPKPANGIVAAAQKRIIDAMAVEPVELDDFGLPIRRYPTPSDKGSPASSVRARSVSSTLSRRGRSDSRGSRMSQASQASKSRVAIDEDSDGDDFEDARSAADSSRGQSASRSRLDAEADLDLSDGPVTPVPPSIKVRPKQESIDKVVAEGKVEEVKASGTREAKASETKEAKASETADVKSSPATESEAAIAPSKADIPTETLNGPRSPPVILTDKANVSSPPRETDKKKHRESLDPTSATATHTMSEFSHQQLTKKEEGKDDDDDGGWQEMPAYAPYDIYDDDNKLVAREHDDAEDETYGYSGLGGAGKGYTRVLVDEDAESATSMDENTQYLFKEVKGTSMMDDDDKQRDAVSQLQATKDLLTEGQRIAYVGMTRLELSAMVKEAEALEGSRKTKKEINMAAESLKMWSQKMMIRLYQHMDINSDEQVMIEQLDAHGVVPSDLTPILMANARVKNPVAEGKGSPTSTGGDEKGPHSPSSPTLEEEPVAEPPPPYEAHAHDGEAMLDVKTPSQLPKTDKIDIDLRWTILCDLFLVLIADSIYDARSRVLLERVGKSLEIEWLDICRFEKRVTDALEMQQNSEKENWNEDTHMEERRKKALTRRYVMMGLATVGGGLVIGLSAGLLAPVIGAGLATGFTAIGVTGTGSFLAGAGGAAIITSGAAASGSIIGVRAASRRTGSVKTFEYRPLHNNKRVNLIVSVSGWMTGKVDDVRLPYSTVDPVMGDIYSVLWEPEMLTSMGDTINILATEALTQGLQQILGSTVLFSLMAALQLPVVLTKLSYLIDNPWAVSLDRATAAGLILADSLIDRNLGTRPVTLVGYSLGSRVIFSCLQELARKGAYGLIQNVYLFGSPVVVKRDEYLRARAVVCGRFVNGFNRNDWILGYLFRLTNGGIRRVAGLAPIEDIPRMENMDVTEHVVGHMDYRTAMPRLLRECGWLVESDEFTEIEDPDPENFKERQRELINEIEEARKELEKEAKAESKGSGAFGLFGRGKNKQLERAEWEVYEDSAKAAAEAKKNGGSNGIDNDPVLFDVEAIRAELAKEQLQVRELQSTLPPMKLEISPRASLSATSTPPPPTVVVSGGTRTSYLMGSSTPPPPMASVASPRELLRETRSADVVRSSHESARSKVSHERTPTLGKMQGFGHTPARSLSQSPGHGHSRAVSGTWPVSGSGSGPGAGGWSTGGSNGWSSGATGSAKSPLYGPPEPADDDIQMSFDTDFSAPPRPAPPPPPKDIRPASTENPSTANLPVRPQPQTSYTAPAITIADPWADPDDEDFGKEKEMTMTFA